MNMKNPSKMTEDQIKFAAYVIIAGAINTIDANMDGILEDRILSTNTQVENLKDTVISQLGWGLSILAYKITGNGMGVSDAIGTQFGPDNIDLDDVIHKFTKHKLENDDTEYPDTQELAKLWCDKVFGNSPNTL
jgi:hypothetical protein